MSKTLRFSAMAVEEFENPRPHYRVQVHGTVKAVPGLSDPTSGLLAEEITMTVRLPVDIGSDLVLIRRAACERAVALLETLVRAYGHETEGALQTSPGRMSSTPTCDPNRTGP